MTPIRHSGRRYPNKVLAKEYFALLDTVRSYDERLMTVNGWGITLSLAALGAGFQTGHAGLVLVAALSGAAFWALEAAFKQFEMGYYVRMREIEVQQSIQRSTETAGTAQSSFAPQIDWSWRNASLYFWGRLTPSMALPPPKRYHKEFGLMFPLLLHQVWLPHALSVMAGAVLFALGVIGRLPTHA